MKRLYLVGGTMGVGKTTACQILKKRLPDCVFLDGDWCWDADPFCVTDETKLMVLDNICHTLNNFLHCSAYQNVIFCWVMHEQAIIDSILSRLDTADCRVTCVSLVCSPEALTVRLQKDVDAGVRQEDIIPRSVPRLPLYQKTDTKPIDVSALTPTQTAEAIMNTGL